MQRYDFFFRQKVTEGELDAAFDAVEQFEFNTHLDQGVVGIQREATVTENSGTPNLTVDISGPAVIRDQLGQRINWTSTQDVDVSVDENSNSTAVTTPGNERYLSIFAKFVRVESDPRLDGTGATVFFNQAEGFEINVVQGAEAALSTASRPPLRADEILLADVLLVFGQTQVLNADILTNRREDAFVITLGSGDIHAGQAEEALQDVASAIEAAAGGGGPYVQVSALADQTTPDDGVTLVGVDALTDNLIDLPQGDLKALLTQVLAAMDQNREMMLLHRATRWKTITDVGVANHEVRSLMFYPPTQDFYLLTEELNTDLNVMIASSGMSESTSWSVAGPEQPIAPSTRGYQLYYSPTFGRVYIICESAAGDGQIQITTDPDGVAYTNASLAGTVFAGGGGNGCRAAIENGTALVVVGEVGAVRSVNGTTFANATVPAGWGTGGCFDVAASPGGTIIAVGWDGTNGTIYRSTDDGQNFADVTPSVPASPISGIFNGIAYDERHGVWIACGSVQSLDEGGVWVSDDDGQTWSYTAGALDFLGNNTRYTVLADEFGTVIVTGSTSTACAVSIDGGATWAKIAIGTAGDAGQITLPGQRKRAVYTGGRFWIGSSGTGAASEYGISGAFRASP